MNVLIGVCGIGNGHCTRQYEIARALVKKGHNIKILTFSNGLQFFKDKEFKFHKVWVPYVVFKGDKYDYKNIFLKNIKKILFGIIRNIFIYIYIKINFEPDLCISDYEPNTARIAYIFNVPFITIDQQSKFLYMDKDDLNGFSCKEERKRLDLFFPKFDLKIITSFYKLQNIKLPKNVFVCPPIIRNDITSSKRHNYKNKVVVYFSKYINTPIGQSMDDVFREVSFFEDYIFIFYLDKNEYIKINKMKHVPKNIIIKIVNRKSFVNDLLNSCAVLTTAGHTLISEAIFLKIPLYIIPLGTFDQHYCANFVSLNKIGYSSYKITKYELSNFLKKLYFYENNIKNCDNILINNNVLDDIVLRIEQVYEFNN
jgi:uncharacterized protein (TIGR00661 family)